MVEIGESSPLFVNWKETKLGVYFPFVSRLVEPFEIEGPDWPLVHYGPLFGLILETSFPELAKDLIKKIDSRKASLEDLLKELKERAPFKGYEVLEIGGVFARVLTELGAESLCITSWRSYWGKGPGWEIKGPFLTPENYDKLIGERKFGLTISRFLFDFSPEALMQAFQPFEENQRVFWEMLDMFARATKDEGLSIHQGNFSYLGLEPKRLAGLGFREVRRVCFNENREPDQNDLLVFRKSL